MDVPCPGLCNGGGVGEHANSPLHLGQVSSRDHRGRLVIDPNFEASRTPVDELDTSLALDSSDRRVDILGHDIATVEHAAGHVLAMPGVALHHGVGRLEAGVGDLCHAQRLMVGFLGRDDGSIGDQREVNPEECRNISIMGKKGNDTYLG